MPRRHQVHGLGHPQGVQRGHLVRQAQREVLPLGAGPAQGVQPQDADTGHAQFRGHVEHLLEFRHVAPGHDDQEGHGEPGGLGVPQALDRPVEAARHPDVPVVRGGRRPHDVDVHLADADLLQPAGDPGGQQRRVGAQTRHHVRGQFGQHVQGVGPVEGLPALHEHLDEPCVGHLADEGGEFGPAEFVPARPGVAVAVALAALEVARLGDLQPALEGLMQHEFHGSPSWSARW